MMGLLSRRKKDSSTSVVSSYGEVTPSREDLPASQQSFSSSVSEEKEVDVPAHTTPAAYRRHQKIKTEEHTGASVQVNVYAAPPSPAPAPVQSRSSVTSPRTPSTIPKCPVCSLNCTREKTRTSNRNGNAGRWYWKCYPCNKFLMWDQSDPIGLKETNPKCHCGDPSRADMSGRDKGRKIFYKCASGGCEYFSFLKNDDGTDRPGVTDEVADILRSMNIA